MNVDKSTALLYIVVVWVTVSRSTDNDKMMDDSEAKQHNSDATTRVTLLRQRTRSASIGHVGKVSTNEPGETPVFKKQRCHVASFDFNYVSSPFILSLWNVLSSFGNIGQMIILLLS